MKKKIHLKITLVFFLCLILQLSIQAQTHKYFIITGKIVSDSEQMDKSSLQIIKNNKPALISEISGTGRFRLELDYNSDYQLTFIQAGFLAKTIKVNTDIPEEINKLATNYPHFLMEVKLIKDNLDASNLNTKDLIQQISYSPEIHNFTRKSTLFVEKYVDADKGDLSQIKVLQSTDSKSKLTTNQSF